MLLAERHQQRLDFKMLEKEVQEQLKVESIVLQAQLKSEIKESVYVSFCLFGKKTIFLSGNAERRHDLKNAPRLDEPGILLHSTNAQKPA